MAQDAPFSMGRRIRRWGANLSAWPQRL